MPILKRPHGRTVSRNAHLKGAAASIEAAAAITQQHMEVSLQADAYPVTIYQRYTSGAKCTCSETVEDGPVSYDSDGNASPPVIDTLLTAARFGIEDYSKRADLTIPPIPVAADDNISDLLEGELNENLTDSLNFTSLNSFFNSSCPVCFGTGYVGGYAVLGGSRRVFDCSMISASDGVEQLRTNTDQLRFVSDNGYVDFHVILPALALTVDALRVWDGFSPAVGTRILQVVAGIEQEPTRSTLCVGLPVHLRIRGKDEVTFSHLEIQVTTSNYPYAANYPYISNGFDPLRVNPWDPVSLELGPSVPSVQAFDVICDSHHQKRWLVTNVTCRKTAGGTIFGWEVNARVIEPHEPYNSLVIRPGSSRRATGPQLVRWHPGGNAF